MPRSTRIPWARSNHEAHEERDKRLSPYSPSSHDTKRLIQQIERAIRLLLRQHERRRQPDGVRPGPEYEQAALEAFAHDPVALGRRALLRLAVAHELDANHQAASPDVANHR